MRKMILMAAAILLQQLALARCGGGVDFKHIALRPQLDCIGTTFSATHINMVCGSFGIAFRFGNP
ncbi:MAG: hypothetical protein WBB89_18370 [Candidatus Acidiferrum sp.]